VARIGRKLSEIELDSYDVIDRPLGRTVHIINVPFVPGGYAGITFGRFVYLAKPIPPDGTSTLLAHKLVHVGQYADIGIPRYIYLYLKSFVPDLVRMKNWNQAYRAIPFEVEARQVTGIWQRHRIGR
jgi:hypothetical protein